MDYLLCVRPHASLNQNYKDEYGPAPPQGELGAGGMAGGPLPPDRVYLPWVLKHQYKVQKAGNFLLVFKPLRAKPAYLTSYLPR